MPQIDFEKPVDALINWMRVNLEFAFDFINDLTGGLVDGLTALLLLPPPMVVTLLFAAAGWWLRSWGFALFTLLSFALIDSMGFWDDTTSTLALVLIAAAIAVIIGIPVGIVAARNRIVSTIVRPILDFMQTMPAFIYLLVAVIFFAIGVVPGVVASLIFAMPPAVRLTELGIRQVDPEVVEAAEAFGSRPGQVLWQVQLPLAMPTIMAGINQVIMLSLSMVVIAGLGGAGGLGALVVRAVTRLEIGLGFESGLAVVLLAVFLDRVTSGAREKMGSRSTERQLGLRRVFSRTRAVRAA
jgi:ABC-type proline/glycine betaine transport system permease subunit